MRTRFLAVLAFASTFALAGCGGTDAGLITINGPSGLSVKHFEISFVDEPKMDAVIAPMMEGAAVKLPAKVSFTFPGGIRGYIKVHVDAYVGGTKTGTGDGFNMVVKAGVTPIDVTLAPFTPPPPTDGGTPNG